jgi:hypothetical protein
VVLLEFLLMLADITVEYIQHGLFILLSI